MYFLLPGSPFTLVSWQNDIGSLSENEKICFLSKDQPACWGLSTNSIYGWEWETKWQSFLLTVFSGFSHLIWSLFQLLCKLFFLTSLTTEVILGNSQRKRIKFHISRPLFSRASGVMLLVCCSAEGPWIFSFCQSTGLHFPSGLRTTPGKNSFRKHPSCLPASSPGGSLYNFLLIPAPPSSLNLSHRSRLDLVNSLQNYWGSISNFIMCYFFLEEIDISVQKLHFTEFPKRTKICFTFDKVNLHSSGMIFIVWWILCYRIYFGLS